MAELESLLLFPFHQSLIIPFHPLCSCHVPPRNKSKSLPPGWKPLHPSYFLQLWAYALHSSFSTFSSISLNSNALHFRFIQTVLFAWKTLFAHYYLKNADTSTPCSKAVQASGRAPPSLQRPHPPQASCASPLCHSQNTICRCLPASHLLTPSSNPSLELILTQWMNCISGLQYTGCC